MTRPNLDPGAHFGRSRPLLPSPATIIADFLDSDLCRKVRTAMDRGPVEPAEILEEGAALDVQARCASVIDVDPATLAAVEGRLDAVRTDLSARCGVQLGGREGVGFIRYSEGGFYGPHRDRAIDGDWPAAARRRIAVVVFLNTSRTIKVRAASDRGEFSGGELVIYPEAPYDDTPIRVAPRQGLLAAFDASLVHEVLPVAGGNRDVIVDWYYEPEA